MTPPQRPLTKLPCLQSKFFRPIQNRQQILLEPEKVFLKLSSLLWCSNKMTSVFIGNGAGDSCTITTLVIPISGQHTSSCKSIDAPVWPEELAGSDEKTLSGSISEVSRASKEEEEEDNKKQRSALNKVDTRSGRFVNIVRVQSPDMNGLLTVEINDKASRRQMTKEPVSSASSSGIDTDPEKSDSEEADNGSYSSLGDEDGSLPADENVFFVNEYENPNFEDASNNGCNDHLSELGKIMSVRGTVRGVKNRVRAGIATFLQQEENVKNFQKCEIGKVVVYTTTMGIVRRTYDRCRLVRNILRNLMIRYDERDVFMNRSTQTELMDRLSLNRVIVPQVFIEGQLLGDAEQIEKLNETGELRKMLRPYKRTAALVTCEKCGGYKYVLCPICNGSKKSPNYNSFMEYSPLRCMHCDEGGLMKCDLCVDL